MTFSKYKCWQTDRIGQVIAIAALDIDRNTFLATHMPMRKISYESSPLQIMSTNEDDFLAELSRMNSKDFHVFAVIKGITGAGKSHLIRWLYEEYKINHPEQNIIIIERANTSLKRTIEQIISSGIFESASFANELKQLRGAVDALSESGLEDTLLNHLQVGALEIEAKWTEKLHRRISAEKISKFLLDINVRNHLKRNDGPIKKVVRYMQEGRGIEEDETPGFEPADLIFDAQQRNQIRYGGYQDAQDVAEVISRTNDKHRLQLTRYLNFLLRNYAISRTTNLTASDLKEMFNEVRRELRKAGQSLALFIEDITAFTGIDAGIIDVIITEHRGESNKEFCKLTSVVGITDAYFTDNIPDNVQERISHLLTLNTSSGRRATILEDKNSLIEFSARYLNAIRLDANTLEYWGSSGANLNEIPNVCTQCEYRETCHTAFGKVNISSDESSPKNEVGLYPFNETSLERMYISLIDTVSHTPRSLLRDIISYILQSHGDKVETGEFPPRDKNLAPRIKTLEFDPPEHRRIIEQQGKEDVDRLTSLLLFWGNRNVYQANLDGKTFVGGLTHDVFQAFALPTMEGRVETGADTTLINDVSPGLSPSAPDIEEEIELPVPESKKEIAHINYITDWANGGALYKHNDFLKWMGQLFIHSIDWQSHGIAPTHVPSSGEASSYFAIEDQSSQVTGNRLVFKRSPILRYALVALANLNNKDISISREQFSEYITALHIWIEAEENRIVAFLRDRTETENLQQDTYSRILLQNSVLLSCLSGDVSADMSLLDMYNAIAQTCYGEERALTEQWKATINNREPFTDWARLMQKIQADVGVVREETLQQFNSAQGDSTQIQFLKAGKIINLLKEFEDQEWELENIPNVPPSGAGQRHWDSALELRSILKNDFFAVITSTLKDLIKTYDKVFNILGEDDPNVVIAQMRDLLQELQPKSPVNPKLLYELPNLKADVLVQLQKEFKQLKGYESNIEIAKHLSKRAVSLRREIGISHQYLKEFIQAIGKKQNELKEKIDTSSNNQVIEWLQRTEQKYIQAIDSIEQILLEE